MGDTRATRLVDDLINLLDDTSIRAEFNGKNMLRVTMDYNTAERLVTWLKKEHPWEEV